MLLTPVLGALLYLALLNYAEALVQVPRNLIGKRAPDASTISIPIDHFGGNQGNFQNRYWYNAQYYKAGGPVFLYDVGEGDGEGYAGLLYESGFHSAVMRLAKKYKGVGVVWEHRYYGQSLPYVVRNPMTQQQLKYHTVEQALEDVVYFANRFSIPHPDNRTTAYRPHPSTTPWVMIGGSYPGNRAAFMRVRNPEIIYASWASSAPVQAQTHMASYWQAARRSLPGNCSNDWVAVTRYVDDILGSGSDSEVYRLKRRLIEAEFTGPGGDRSRIEAENLLSEANIRNTVNYYVARYLMDPLGRFQVNGVEPIIPFCDVVETQNFTQPAYRRGIAEKFGLSQALTAFLTGIAETSPDISAVAMPPGYEDPDTYSWTYQYCSEFGYFQAADPNDPQRIQTVYDSYDGAQNWCKYMFPWLGSPAVDNINLLYGGWTMNPTHVMFTNGEYDPWRTMGVASKESNSPGRVGSIDVPSCHTKPISWSYFGAVYRGREHCSDLSSGLGEPSEPFYTSLALFELALDEWLPCFDRKLDANGF